METIAAQVTAYVDQTPGFGNSVELAVLRKSRRPSVTVRLADFDDDPFRLYGCLLFAAGQGVTVSVRP